MTDLGFNFVERNKAGMAQRKDRVVSSVEYKECACERRLEVKAWCVVHHISKLAEPLDSMAGILYMI